jgi:hypothetical protein
MDRPPAPSGTWMSDEVDAAAKLPGVMKKSGSLIRR